MPPITTGEPEGRRLASLQSPNGYFVGRHDSHVTVERADHLFQLHTIQALQRAHISTAQVHISAPASFLGSAYEHYEQAWHST